MKDGAVMFRHIAVAAEAVALPPRATAGMAIGPKVVQPQPTTIVTLGVRTKVSGGVHGTGRRLVGGMGSGRSGDAGARSPAACSHRAQGLVREARERFGLAGADASGWRGGRARLATGSGVVGPQPGEHQEAPHQCNKPEVVEKEGWYHGNAPADDGEMRALYWILGLIELSAAPRYATHCQGVGGP
jgi:hypothetical protein